MWDVLVELSLRERPVKQNIGVESAVMVVYWVTWSAHYREVMGSGPSVHQSFTQKALFTLGIIMKLNIDIYICISLYKFVCWLK